MRILFLTTYFKPDISSNSMLMSQLAEELVKLGNKVTVVTSMPHYDTNSIWPEYRWKLWKKAKYPGMNVTHVYLYVPSQKSSLVGRLFNYLSFNVLSTIFTVFTRKHHVLFVPSPPLTNGVGAFIASRLRRTPFVYNVQDIYPDIAVRLGVLKNERLIKIFEKMEKFVYRKAAAVSVISDGFRRNLLRKGVPDQKIAVIPNYVDAELFRPLPRQNAFSTEQGLNDKFVLLFAGNIGLSQGLENLLEAASILREYPDIMFLIVGNGASKAELERMAEEMKLTNVRFLPYQPIETVPEMYASCDAGLVTLRKNITSESVPSKAFSVLGAGRALITSVDRASETWDMVEGAQCGVAIEPEDPQALADAVLSLYNDREKTIQMGKNGRKHIEEHYTKQIVARQYQELFANLVARKGG
ncbi:MAG TPA: glycosyltransferase family 4 protein [Fimbriimonadaceae bacterium]|nr:glycosyltransferase family 4 protein [Fimbriimonadaceae bacterium]